ncbi:hypothetical protein ABPG73_011040 [Tetrahymena malaccensis]
MNKRQSVEQMLGPQANFQKVELVFSNDDLGIKFQSDLNQLDMKDKELLNSQIHQDKCKTNQYQLDNTSFLSKTMEQSVGNLQQHKLITNNMFNNSDVDQLKSETQRAHNNEDQISSNLLFNVEQKKFSQTQNLFINIEKVQSKISQQQYEESLKDPAVEKQNQIKQISRQKQKKINRALFDLLPLILLLISRESLELQKVYLSFSFLKLKNTLRDIKTILKILKIYTERLYILMLLQLVFKIFIFSHIIACLWYLIGQIEINILDLNKTWYSHLDSDDLTWWNIYLDSFNWAITVLVTGQNIVSSPLQRLFSNFLLMFTVLFFGYILNETKAIINSYQLDSKQFSESSIKINKYMNRLNTPRLIQMKANDELENFHAQFYDKINDEALNILKQISPETQRTIKLEYLLCIMKKIDFLNKKFSIQTLTEMAEISQEEFYGIGQMIISQKEQSQASLIYVVGGELEVFQHFQKNDQKQVPIQILKQGDFFGQYNFLTGQFSQISVRTKTPAKVIKLSREQFLEIIKNKEDEFEIFSDLKDKIIMTENYEQIGQNCIFCQSSNHLQVECPIIHLPKKLFYYTSKFTQNAVQSRQLQERKKSKSNPLYSFKQNKMTAKRFIQNFRIQLKENNEMKRNIGLCLLYNLSSEDLSSEENENESAKDNSILEESKDDNQRFQQRLSSKKISQNAQEISNHKTQTIIQNNPASQQMDTIVIDSLLNNIDEIKVISQKSAQTIQYSSKYQLQTQSQKNRLSTSQFLIEDEVSNKKNTNVLLPNSTSFFNNLDPEFKSEVPQTTSVGTKYTKQQISIAEFSNNRTKSLENEKSQQYDLDLNSISKYLKAKKSVFFSQQDNNADFDRLRNYSFYFPLGNSLNIFKKYERYQKKLFNKNK